MLRILSVTFVMMICTTVQAGELRIKIVGQPGFQELGRIRLVDQNLRRDDQKLGGVIYAEKGECHYAQEYTPDQNGMPPVSASAGRMQYALETAHQDPTTKVTCFGVPNQQFNFISDKILAKSPAKLILQRRVGPHQRPQVITADLNEKI